MEFGLTLERLLRDVPRLRYFLTESDVVAVESALHRNAVEPRKASTPCDHAFDTSPNTFFTQQTRDSTIFFKFMRAAQNLDPNESLNHCERCSNPARIYKNVGRCTSLLCGHVYCTKCARSDCQSVRYFESLGEISTPDVLEAAPPCSRAPLAVQLAHLKKSTSMDSGIIDGLDETLNETPRTYATAAAKRLVFRARKPNSEGNWGRASSLQLTTLLERSFNSSNSSVESPAKRTSLCIRKARRNLRRL